MCVGCALQSRLSLRALQVIVGVARRQLSGGDGGGKLAAVSSAAKYRRKGVYANIEARAGRVGVQWDAMGARKDRSRRAADLLRAEVLLLRAQPKANSSRAQGEWACSGARGGANGPVEKSYSPAARGGAAARCRRHVDTRDGGAVEEPGPADGLQAWRGQRVSQSDKK